MQIAQTLGDRIFEAQACYSLGNTFSLLGNYRGAIQYHLRHLEIAQELRDRVGESRAYWSLGNAYTHLEHPEIALQYANQHLQLSEQLNDRAGQETAIRIVADLQKRLQQPSTAQTLPLTQQHLNQQISRQATTTSKLIPSNHREQFDNKRATQVCQTDLDQVAVSIQQRNTISIEHRKSAQINTQSVQSVVQKPFSYSQSTQPKLKQNQRKKELFKQPLATAFEFAARQQQLQQQQRNSGVVQPAQQKALSTHHPKPPVDCCTASIPAQILKTSPRSVVNRGRKSMDKMELLKLTPTNDPFAKASDGTSKSNNKSADEHEPIASTSGLNQKTVDDIDSITIDNESENDQFFDLLANFQSQRMDDQRCPFDVVENKENCRPERLSKFARARKLGQVLNRTLSSNTHAISASISKSATASTVATVGRRNSSCGELLTSSSSLTGSEIGCRDELFDLIAGIQGRRMDEQRAPLPPLRRSQTSNGSSTSMEPNDSVAGSADRRSRQLSLSGNIFPDDEFFDMLMRCQASRLEDQRSTLPTFAEAANNNTESVLDRNLFPSTSGGSRSLATESTSAQSDSLGPSFSQTSTAGTNDDEFFSLILKFQAGRIDEQRSQMPNDEQVSIEPIDSNLAGAASIKNVDSK